MTRTLFALVWGFDGLRYGMSQVGGFEGCRREIWRFSSMGGGRNTLIGIGYGLGLINRWRL